MWYAEETLKVNRVAHPRSSHAYALTHEPSVVVNVYLSH
jgi:hypothetical protein